MRLRKTRHALSRKRRRVDESSLAAGDTGSAVMFDQEMQVFHGRVEAGLLRCHQNMQSEETVAGSTDAVSKIPHNAAP